MAGGRDARCVSPFCRFSRITDRYFFICHPLRLQTSVLFQTIDNSLVPVSDRYTGLPRRPRFGRQRGAHPVSCQYDTFGFHQTQSQWDASFHLHQNVPSPAHTAFQAPFIYPLSCEISHRMYGVIILGIDTAQYRIGHGDGTAHAHIAISLSQPVHSYVNLLPSTTTPIVIKKRRLYTNSCIYQISPSHTDAAYRCCPRAAASEQVKSHFCDLCTGASRNRQLPLSAIPVQLFVPDADLDHCTLRCQLPHSAGDALGQQIQHEAHIIVIDQVTRCGGTVAHRLYGTDMVTPLHR